MSQMMVTITPQRRVEEERSIPHRLKLTTMLIFLEAVFVVLFGVFLRYDKVAMPNPMGYVPINSSGAITMNPNATFTMESTTTSTTTTPTTQPGVNGSTESTITTHAPMVHNGSAVSTPITSTQAQDRVWGYKKPEEILAHEEAYRRHIPDNYPIYQDIHVMMFVGFGFLVTYLCRYGLSSISYNFVLAAMCIQWAALTDGWIRRRRFQGKHDYYIYVSINTMTDSDYALCSALVAFGALVGHVSLLQLVIMGMAIIPIYQANCLMIYDLLKANDPGYSMTVHVFGALFGLIVSRIVSHKDVEHEAQKKGGSVYHSDIFAMIGTLFLWTLYPSFNSYNAKDEGRIRAIINTYFALTASVMTSFAMTSILNKEKFNMLHVQNATLAGGVAVGTIAAMIIQPWGALLVGFVAGIVSVMGYQFLTPCMRKYWGLHDTRGIFNVHLMPGLISGFGSILAAGVATHAKYGDGLDKIFWHEHNTVGKQAGYQAAALAVTIGTAVIGGILTGTVMKLPIWDQPRYDDILDDEPRWKSVAQIPGDEPTIRWNPDTTMSSKQSMATTEFSTPKEIP